MDPDSCLDRLLDAATSGDAAGLRQAASDLASWLDRGGFPPRDPRQHRRTSTRASRPNRHRRGRG